jgi:acyl dehydratase
MNHPSPLSLSELQQKIGQTLGVSDWQRIDQALIDRFAELTHDRHFIHIDPARAQTEGPYGGTIAHGFLILSLLSHMAEQSLPACEGLVSAVNYGFDTVRFLAPVRSGSRVRAHFTLAAAGRRAATQVLIRYEARVEIEGEAGPALIADWLSLIFLQ